jgi:hypothetical protein
MALATRENPETRELEVLVDGEWTPFQAYRQRQIDTAYLNSIRFLRDRLGEQATQEMTAPEEKPFALTAREEP